MTDSLMDHLEEGARDRIQAWDTLELSERESRLLLRHASLLLADPYGDLDAFREAADAAWAFALSPCTRDLVHQLVDGTSRRPELYVTGLPIIDDLPPTPIADAGGRSVASSLSEFLMMTFCAGLGSPISYPDQRRGSVFHDVFPTPGNAAQVSSQSSEVSLGFHTEMFFHPDPPDFLLIHCLRSDPAGKAVTAVAALDDIERELTARERFVLRQQLFAVDLAHLHGSYVCGGRPIRESDPRPVISVTDSGADGRLRFEPELTTALTDEAREALHRADEVAGRVAATGSLRAGGMLLLDNRRAAHSRSPFPAAFDGSDRWLRRMMVGATRSSASAVDHRDVMELAHAWAELDVRLDVLPYEIRHQEVK